MDKFFKENKVFLAIIIGALVIGGAAYLGVSKRSTDGDGNSTGALKNCQNIPELPDGATKLATKIIDGDTFLIEGGHSVRILGIDADERGYSCYQKAKDRLEELILNKEVKLEAGKEDKDQWCRYLRYVFLDAQNISLVLVTEGLAIVRFSPEDIVYREEIATAEKEARENEVGCKWGKGGSKEGDVSEQVREFAWERLTTDLTGLSVVGACQAGNYLGRDIIIEGRVADTNRSKTNTVFLNFEKVYPNQCFTGVIFSSDQYKFSDSPEDFYLNKTVRIRGEIKEYEGRAEIILDNPSQIEVGK